MPDAGFEHVSFGPWETYDERSDDPKVVVAALNVRLEKGRIRRRPGRQQLQTLSAEAVLALHEHVSVDDGYRQLLAVTGDVSSPTLGLVDLSGNAVPTAIALPQGGGLALDRRSTFQAVMYRGHLVLADQYARLLDYDGRKLLVLEAVQGLDAERAGGRTYLGEPPRATLLAVWRNRVVAIHGHTVGFSASSDDAMIPAAAKASGASMWPSSANFDALTAIGDEVMGVAILNDRLVLPTRRGLIEADEDLGSPIPRQRDGAPGCLARRSVVACGSQVIYLGDGHVYAYDGNAAQDISDPIRETLSEVNWPLASDAIAVNVTRRGEYWLWLPVYGESENNVLLIFDYVRARWQPPQAAWYPFDKVSRVGRPADFEVRAALAPLSQASVEYLVTGDASGGLWLEDVTELDDTAIFPAYALLGSLGEGERIFSWGDMRLHTLLDGSQVVFGLLDHGILADEEIVRALDSATLKAQHVEKRMMPDAGHKMYSDVAAWGVDPKRAKAGRFKFGLRARSARAQILFRLPGTGSAGDDPAPGGIGLLEASVRQRKGGGRGGD